MSPAPSPAPPAPAPAREPEPASERPAVNLFPAEAIASVATPPPQPPAPESARRAEAALPADELARRRLAQWRDEWVARSRAAHGDVSPELKALGQRFADWFLVDDKELTRSSSLVPTNLLARRRSIFCFGACDDSSHEVAALAVVLELEHDERGKPRGWTVAESSGRREFDRMALAAIETTLDPEVSAAVALDPRVRRSRWEFRAAALRWGRLERVLDPQFEPPGKKLDHESGILGDTTMVREVRLVAVLYERARTQP